MSFQQCSHSVSSSVYQTVQEMRDPAEITLNLCRALETIATKCTMKLKDCFNNEDLRRTRDQRLLEIKAYFLQTSLAREAKVTQESLTKCSSFTTGNKPDEPLYEEYEEYVERMKKNEC